MKKVYTPILALLIMAGLWSCSAQTGTGLPVADIEDAIDNIKSVKLSKYATGIKYIKLETADSALLGNISTIAFDDKHIYIGSTDKQKTIHLFSKDGKFIKNVGTRGRASGEYTAIRSIIPLQDMNAIMVEGGNKAVIYSLEDGKALKDIPFEKFLTEQVTTTRIINGRNVTSKSQHVQNIFYDGTGSFTILTFDKNSGKQDLIILDTALAVKNTIALRPGEKYTSETYTQKGAVIKFPPMAISGLCYINNGDINFFHGMHDTLYTVKEDKAIPKLAINYGYYQKDPHNLTAEDIWARVIHESDNLIFLDARMPVSNKLEANANGTAHMIYDKNLRETILLKFSKDLTGDFSGVEGGGAFLNDLDNGLPFWPYHLEGNKMYMICDAGKFIELSDKYNSIKMKEVASQLTDESNPILIEVTLK